MVMDGKQLRLRRLSFEDSGKYIIVPLDHGVSSGPIEGIIDLGEAVKMVAEGGATAVVLHKGMAPRVLEDVGGRLGFIMHLSGSTSISSEPDSKVIIATVEEALQLGADAVSIHVNVGSDDDDDMLEDLGAVSSSCREWQVPLLAMMYPRGPDISDPFDVEVVKHVARVGAELGADIVKTNYTGSPETFKEVVSGCPVPVVIAGGPKAESTSDVLKMVKDAMNAGAMGVSIGRNIFQHSRVANMTRAIARIVTEDIEVDYAYQEISR
jgi:predicted phospho-2-dehydro-3-deoxyheptonate aldolase